VKGGWAPWTSCLMSKRGSPTEAEFLTLQEGVPEHLQSALISWTIEQVTITSGGSLRYDYEYLRTIQLDVQVSVGSQADEMVNALRAKCKGTPLRTLTSLTTSFGALCRKPFRPHFRRDPRAHAQPKSRITSTGHGHPGSFRPFGDVHSLERRIDPVSNR
jgi:hypothetical protein